MGREGQRSGGSLTPLRIRSVDPIILSVSLGTPWRIATATMDRMVATLVRVELEDGTRGWGECLVRQAPGATRAIIDELLGPLVVGEDAWCVEALWDRMWATMRARGHSRGFMLEAIAGIDIAIWDALGRSLGEPIWRLLHGHGRPTVPCYASSILLKSLPEVADEARSLAAAGHTGVKVKIGRGIAEDAETAATVREALGAHVELMLDANGYYQADHAIRLAERVRHLDVAWLEEPLPPDDLTGYARLSRACPWLPLAAGEAEFAPTGLLPYLKEGILDVVQPDVARAGGITGCKRIASLVAAFNLPLAPHTGASSGICIAAALQLAGSISNLRTLEYMYVKQPLQDLFATPLPEPFQGEISIPRGPGLGLEVDEEKVGALAIA
jgi:L-alanine-DL-glutamate epimerase-like enolase superfamily enzyme